MEKKFEMGPLQKMWVASLRKYPERQSIGALGRQHPNQTYTACCLGELHLCYYQKSKKKFPFDGFRLMDGRSYDTLEKSYKKYGLKSPNGKYGKNCFNTLANMNDKGESWAQIADFIEANPEKVFTHPV